MAKKKDTEFIDEYFINLTMPFNQRDDEIYPKWAVWCAKSEDRYYIDGKDGHFYTHVRTDEEIAVEQKRREVTELIFTQSREGKEDWAQYEDSLQEIFMKSNTEILEITPPTYEQWKENQ